MKTAIAVIDYDRTLAWIDQAISNRIKGYICVAAVHTVMACKEDEQLRAAVTNATFTVPDGRPLVWALRLLGHRLPDRVYGPELMARACARAAQAGTRFYLYGGRDEETLLLLQTKLQERFPGLQIVGSFCPPFRPLTADEETAVVNDIASSEADVVWVGIGVPKQEKWMAQMRPRLTAPVLIGVGAAFDFHAGLISQAPAWMQRAGLEWLYRLSREPKRLWRRYLRYNPWFIAAFARQYVHYRLGSRRAG